MALEGCDLMIDYKRLSAENLKIKFDFLPQFEFTSEISPFKEMIGQDRAIEAMDLGMSIDHYGYNLFVSGIDGTGKKSYVLKRIKEYSTKFTEPKDWCYVYNFKENDKPLALELNGGTAIAFKEDMIVFINQLFEEVPKYFGSEKFEKYRSEIVYKHEKNILIIVEKLYDECKKYDFIVKNTSEGFSFTPLHLGEEMTEKRYNELSEEEKEKINEEVAALKLVALDVMRKSKKVKKELSDELKYLDEESAGFVINNKIKMLILKYGCNSKVIEFLKDVEKDIINNIEAFMEEEEVSESYDENFYKRYTVNVISYNAENTGLPVVYENSPEYHNLIGRIEYESKSGNISTDFTAIHGGALHAANGGYLIIDAYALLTNPQSWELIKRALKNNSLSLDNIKTQIDLVPMVSFKPEEIPLKIKIILLGSPGVYYILYNNDDDFKELFKIKVDFEYDIENNNVTTLKLLGFISDFCNENNILPVSRKGVVEIFKYSLRRGESRRYFTAVMNLITSLLIESCSIAKARGCKYINDVHILECIALNNKRHGTYRDKIHNMYKEGKYIVEIKGYKIGEINGLTVIDHSDFSFGKQVRITVATFSGKDGIVNIERETSMSGNIHNKGIMILSGFMGETFGQEIPLSFSASICFEQLYGEVDGDSASAAELIALLSSLGNIPIKQNIAITGSVNQRGEIQPVGGINEKIEGFFDICSFWGLDGSQGVIIPYTNIDELVLKNEVIRAVENEKFHIYGVESIEDCFEIMTREDFKKGSRKKAFEIVKERVEEKLKKYNNISSNTSKE